MLFYMQFVNYSHEKKKKNKHEEAKFENPVFQHMK